MKMRKHRKHYKIRGFSRLCAFKASTRPTQKFDEKQRADCTKIPPSEPTSDSKTFCKKRFWHCWRHFENGPDSARNTMKIGVLEQLGERNERRFRDRGEKGESGPRNWGIWCPFCPFFGGAMLDRISPLKRSVLQREAFFKKKRAKGDQIPFLQHLCHNACFRLDPLSTSSCHHEPLLENTIAERS